MPQNRNYQTPTMDMCFQFARKPLPSNLQSTSNCEGKRCSFIIDSGASVNLIDEPTYNKFDIQPELKPAKSKVFTYGSTKPMEVLGTFESDIESKTRFTCATFYVTKCTHGSLLSYQTASELSLIQICVNSIQEHDFMTVEDLKQLHPELFNGVGKLTHFQVKLHIDESVQPVAQPHRRIPSHIREKVENEIKLELEQDLIERVDGPTPWVSPLVTPPKPGQPGQIRICLDARLVNRAIQRTRYVTPTLDDIIHDLNGAKVFSKMDLKQAYKQLELHPDSRYITTFATHMGLFRYKRMVFCPLQGERNFSGNDLTDTE